MSDATLTPLTRDYTREPPDWVEPFLELYRVRGVVSWAAREVGVSRQRVYAYRDVNPDFAVRMDAAAEEAIDVIEAKAVEVAVQEPNPQLLMFMLRNRRRAVYGDQTKTVIAGDQAAPVKVEHEHSGTVGVSAAIDHYRKLLGADDGGPVGGAAGDGVGQPVRPGPGEGRADGQASPPPQR